MASKDVYERAEFRIKTAPCYCAVPIIGDTYRNCTNGCLYCYERQANNQHLRKRKKVYPRDYKSLFNSLYEIPWIKEWAINRHVPVRIGVCCDPFPMVEPEYKATLKLLTLLARAGISVQLTTKRPTDVAPAHVEMLKRCPKAMVRVSFSTLSDELAKRIEPNAPLPSERLAAITRLSRAGIEMGIRLAPFLRTERDRYDYERLAETGATNVTIELLRWSGLWRHSTDPALWGAMWNEKTPEYNPEDMKDKESFIRKWAEAREQAFFAPLRDDDQPYFAPTNLWVTTDIFKLRELFTEARDRTHVAGMKFGICTMGTGIHNIDLNDAPCGCLTEGWKYEEGALVPAWFKNQWADYRIPEIESQPYDAYLERIIIANSHTYRPIALDDTRDGFRRALLEDEEEEPGGSGRGRDG